MRLGAYTVVRRLATGGMAEVLLARRDGPGGFVKPVALKRILPHLAALPEAIALFEEEARIAARLSHPNIVGVHDFTVVEGAYLLVLEHVAGADLRRLRGPLPAFLVGGIIGAVTAALVHAHAQGVVHGDVSPSNVLVGLDGSVKLCDFGVAGHPGRAGALGKRGYAAPEQRAGAAFDRRADLYAVGVIAFELLTGRRFAGDPALPPSVPRGLADLVAAAVRPHPDERPDSAEAFLGELERVAPAALPSSFRGILAATLAARLSAEEIELGRDLGHDLGDPTVRLAAPPPRRRALGLRFGAVAVASALAAAVALWTEPTSPGSDDADPAQWSAFVAGALAPAVCECPSIPETAGGTVPSCPSSGTASTSSSSDSAASATSSSTR